MVSDIPAPVQVKEDPQKSKEVQFRKAKLFSKSLPPVRIPNCEVITVVEEKPASKRDSQSSPHVSANSPSSYATQTQSQPQPQHRHLTTSALTPPSSTVASRTLQDRPSVLRIAPPSRQPVTVYHSADSSTSSNGEDACVADVYDDRNNNGGTGSRKYDSLITMPAMAQNVISSDLIKQECIKQETMDLEDFEQLQSHFPNTISSTPDHAAVERTGVVRRVDSISNKLDENDERTSAGVVVRRGAIKRHFNFEEPVPVKRNASNLYLTPPNQNVNSVSPSSYQTSFSHNIAPYSLDSATATSNDLDQVPPHMDHFTQIHTIDECDTAARFDHIGK